MELVEPRGVAVYLAAEHLCTHMRGVEEPSSTITTFWRGAFRDPDLRREFLDEARSRTRTASL
jgi:GTP cyclohydrolase IA